jgi:hypothetical protein
MVEEEMAVIAKEGVPDYAARFRDVAGTAFKVSRGGISLSLASPPVLVSLLCSRPPLSL